MAQRVLSSCMSRCTYDVFLSFRGEDTRFGFTGNLYHALLQRGINTFMDDQELKRGEQISPSIFKAIQESRMAIIVFSKNYASSTWCLEELVKILDCKKIKGLTVYPVFYKVNPSDVRHQKGSYGQQLAKHEENMKGNKEKVQNWRLALREAANLSGWHFKDRCAYEHEFISRIIETVGSLVNCLPFDEYLVGLESRIPNITFRLQMSAPTVIMVGICGVSGIGKTTLAQALYNSIHHQFEGSCFLSDVRGNSTRYGLAYLQEVILADIARENIKVVNEHKGISILIRKLQGKRVLLMLDNVDKLEQLLYLAGECNWFGLGSRIIITSRSKDVLTCHGVENIYDVQKLDYYEAMQLLSSQVSKSKGPPIPAYYNAVLERVFHCSRGLPLLLKVIGSHLSEKMKAIGFDLSETSTRELEIAIDNYEQVCDGDIQSKVSYDSLNEFEKRIFLDIACFFIGEPVSYVEEILSACGFYPKYGIRRLINRSLLSITPCARLMMHDHIIDMAMNIVQQESPLHPGKRSRLWLPQDVIQVLDENEGTDKIEVMMLVDLPQENDVVKFSDKAFKKMKNLRIVIIKDAIYSGVPQHLPNSLRVLIWSGYPSRCLPPDFLNLPSDCLILNKFKNMGCLTEMDFADCEYLSEVPDISGIPHLRKLYLDNCINLIKIHDSVGFLSDLEELTATRCTNLKAIPSALKLASLRELSLSECLRLERFPEILCETENLKCLNLWQTAIEELPFTIRNLRGLESLNLMECTRLDKLPSSIFTLPRLMEIQADSCRRFDISIECEDPGKQRLTVSPNKVYLYLSSCNLTSEHVVACLSGFANMVHLDISYNNFTVLPACINECIQLKTLLLNNCKQLKDISVIPPTLEELDALNCTSLTSQSSSVLLNQAFHATGQKNVILPGSRIPKWFDHYSSERSITFWGRERFPRICVCVSFGTLENPPHHFALRFCVIINGDKRIFSRHCYGWSIDADHVWLFDLTVLVCYGDHMGKFLNREWNHVEISYCDCEMHCNSCIQVENGSTRMAFVKRYGIHVYREESKMEDFIFEKATSLHENNTRKREDNEVLARNVKRNNLVIDS